MNLFDAHNHLQDARFDADRDRVLDQARAAGVTRMAVCGTTESDWPRVQALARAHDAVRPCYGLHPWWMAGRSPTWRTTLVELLQQGPAAVGEIGLDQAIQDRDDADQEAVFLEQLALSREFKRPVVIHCRRAWGRMLDLLQAAGPHPAGYLLHAYSGGADRVDRLVPLNAWFSFGGSLTYPTNRRGPRALRAVPRDRLLLETDAPDMAPAGCETCEPAHIRHTLQAAARHLALTEEVLAGLAHDNAMRLFEERPR